LKNQEKFAVPTATAWQGWVKCALTYVAAILFYLETTVRVQGAHPTCTQEKCEWIIPSYLKNAEYRPLRNIDFTSAQGKKRKLQ